MIMVCTVFSCGWTWTGDDPQALAQKEREHFEAYHEPKKEDDDGDS